MTTSSRCSTASICSPSIQSQNGTSLGSRARGPSVTWASPPAARAAPAGESALLATRPASASTGRRIGAPTIMRSPQPRPVAGSSRSRSNISRRRMSPNSWSDARRDHDQEAQLGLAHRGVEQRVDVVVGRGEVLVLDVDVLARRAIAVRSACGIVASPAGDHGSGTLPPAGPRRVAAAAHLHQVARRLRRHLVASLGAGVANASVERGGTPAGRWRLRRTPSGARTVARRRRRRGR